MWAKSYDRDLGDLLAGQCDVAREIVREVTSAASLASVPAPPVSRPDRLSAQSISL
jgi:hypothetical protein